MSDSKTDEKLLEKARERYKASVEAWSDNREAALDDIKFARLGEQWPDDVKKQRESKGRPCLTINKLPAFIRQIVNDSRINSPSIKVHPVDDYADPDTADVINGIIRNIEKASNAEACYDTAIDNSATCGEGYFRIAIDYATNDSFELDIVFERIANPLSVHIDPFSMAVDASDWTYCFVDEVMSHEAFELEYPNADKVDWEGDKDGNWITDDTIRVSEYWTREEVDAELVLLSNGVTLLSDRYEEKKQLFDISGVTVEQTRPTKSYKVTQRIITGEQVLETVDHAGQYIPIIPIYGDEIVVENKRYFHSLVRQAKDAQRSYNYWRSSATEKVALATKTPWIGPKGSFETDADKWATSNLDAHAYIEYDGPVPPQQTMPSMADAGSITEALSASDDLKSIIGLQDASMGIAGNETSGKAIMARQREGDVSTYHFSDNLARGIRYAGQVLLDLIPHIYSKPRVMRIMGVDGTPDTIQVNQKYQVNTPAGPIEKMHDLTLGKYDLVVEVGPSFTSKREEASTQMIDMVRSYPDIAPIIGDLIAKNLDWPEADEIAKRLRTMLPPQIQALDKLDNLPPEAQSAISQAQEQIKQMTQMIEQGKQMLTQKDEQIKMLDIENKSKQDEIAIKERDSQRKYQADMAKVEADMQIASNKETEANRRMVMTESLDALKMRFEQSQEEQTIVSQDSLNGIQAIAETVSNQNEVLHEVVNAISEGQNKSIEVHSPSGEIYSGTVEDGEITITAPSGANYTGNITEH